MIENKKPFGLTIACKIAAQAIKEEVAPVSVVISNLLILQKETTFPKPLETYYFSTLKKMPTDSEKRIISRILEDLRGLHIETSELLESYVRDGWTFKKSAPEVSKKTTYRPDFRQVKKTYGGKNT